MSHFNLEPALRWPANAPEQRPPFSSRPFPIAVVRHGQLLAGEALRYKTGPVRFLNHADEAGANSKHMQTMSLTVLIAVKILSYVERLGTLSANRAIAVLSTAKTSVTMRAQFLPRLMQT